MGWKNKLPRREHHDARAARKAANRAEREGMAVPIFRDLPAGALRLIKGGRE